MRKEKQQHGGELVRSEPGETGNPNGRPKKLVSSLIAQLKEEGYERVTNSQITDVISLLLNLEKDRIKTLAEDTRQPIYVQRISRRLISATDKEIGDFIDKQLDRAHGKPKQRQEITGEDGAPINIAPVVLNIAFRGTTDGSPTPSNPEQSPPTRKGKKKAG